MTKKSALLKVVAGVERVSGGLAILGVVSVFIMMFGVSVDVILRLLVSKPIPGVTEFSELLMAVIVFLGLAFTQIHNRHVKVELLTLRLSPRHQEVLGLVTAIIALGLMILFVMYTGRAAIESIQVQEFRYGLIRFPIWPSRLALPIGGFVLCVYLAVDLLRRIHPQSIGRGRETT